MWTEKAYLSTFCKNRLFRYFS